MMTKNGLGTALQPQRINIQKKKEKENGTWQWSLVEFVELLRLSDTVTHCYLETWGGGGGG